MPMFGDKKWHGTMVGKKLGFEAPLKTYPKLGYFIMFGDKKWPGTIGGFFGGVELAPLKPPELEF